MVALYFGAEKPAIGQSLEKGVPDSPGSGLVSTPCFVNLCLHDLKTNILQNTISGGTNSLTEALPPGAEPHCVCARRSTMFGSFEWDILPDPAESLPEYERVYSMEYFF